MAEKKYLQMSGNQWKYRRQYPSDVAERLGKRWFVRNTGTDSLKLARQFRDRFNVEFYNNCRVVELQEAEMLQDYQNATEGEREVLSNVYRFEAEMRWEDADRRKDGKGQQDAVEFYKRITGQVVPIGLHHATYLSQAPATDKTQKARTVALERLSEWLKGEYLHDVTQRVVGDYVDHLNSMGLASKTTNNQISALGGYWRWMVRRGLVDDNPFRDQSVPQVVLQERDAFTLPQVHKLIANAPTKVLEQAITVGAHTGFRLSELTNLMVSDCAGGVFKVTSGKTKASTRTMPIHSQLADVMKVRLIGDGYLFPEFDGKGTRLSMMFSRYRDKQFPGRTVGTQSPLVWHSLRHFWVNERVKVGCQPHLVRELVGHKQEGVTLGIYYHGMDPETARGIVEAVQL